MNLSPNEKKPHIIVAINYVNYNDPDKKKWQKNAINTLLTNKPSNVEIVSFNFPDEEIKLPSEIRVFKTLKRNSRKVLGNNRDLPFVKEIFDQCAQLRGNIFGYINSDILIPKDTFNLFTWQNNVYLFQRTDISDVSVKQYNNRKYKKVWDKHPGFDAIFFRKQWWNQYNHKFNSELVLGEPEWDYYYYKRIRRITKLKKVLVGRHIDHIFHKTIWTLNSKGAINNRVINGSIAQ